MERMLVENNRETKMMFNNIVNETMKQTNDDEQFIRILDQKIKGLIEDKK